MYHAYDKFKMPTKFQSIQLYRTKIKMENVVIHFAKNLDVLGKNSTWIHKLHVLCYFMTSSHCWWGRLGKFWLALYHRDDIHKTHTYKI